jgi:hypothetical protein
MFSLVLLPENRESAWSHRCAKWRAGEGRLGRFAAERTGAAASRHVAVFERAGKFAFTERSGLALAMPRISVRLEAERGPTSNPRTRGTMT